MPYTRCSSCGVLSYVSRAGATVRCPECGLPLSLADLTGGGDAEPVGTDAAEARRERQLDELLRMTRDLLDADVALLTEIRDGREIAERAAGSWPELGPLPGASLPLEETFCQRMLDGRIGNYVADALADERVCDLAMTRELGLRSWMGVPIRRADLRLYVLCCLARDARPSLGERELRLLAGLAESVKALLEPL